MPHPCLTRTMSNLSAVSFALTITMATIFELDKTISNSDYALLVISLNRLLRTLILHANHFPNFNRCSLYNSTKSCRYFTCYSKYILGKKKKTSSRPYPSSSGRTNDSDPHFIYIDNRTLYTMQWPGPNQLDIPITMSLVEETVMSEHDTLTLRLSDRDA